MKGKQTRMYIPLYTSVSLISIYITNVTINSAAFARLTNVINRQTDRPCYSVSSNRLHPAIAVTSFYHCFVTLTL